MKKTHLVNKISVHTLILIRYVGLIIILLLVTSVTTQAIEKDTVTQKKVQSFKSSNYDIIGNVVDMSTNKGFAGVRISVVNTQITTMTTDDGTFEIKVPSHDATFSVDA